MAKQYIRVTHGATTSNAGVQGSDSDVHSRAPPGKRSSKCSAETSSAPFGLGLLGLPLAASAQPAWPNKPIRIIVPVPPGGSLDILARTIAKDLGPKLHQSVVVENMAGGGSNIAFGHVAKAQPDVAHYAAIELARLTTAAVAVLEGGTQAWADAKLPLVQGETHLASDRIDRYRRPYEGTDNPRQEEIEAFARRWHDAHPWLKDVAAVTRTRLDRMSTAQQSIVEP